MINYICSWCKSTHIKFDADVIWNVEKQAYEVTEVNKNCICENCDGETSYTEIKVDPPKTRETIYPSESQEVVKCKF